MAALQAGQYAPNNIMQIAAIMVVAVNPQAVNNPNNNNAAIQNPNMNPQQAGGQAVRRRRRA